MHKPVDMSFRINVPNTATGMQDVMRDVSTYMQALADAKAIHNFDLRHEGKESFIVELFSYKEIPDYIGKGIERRYQAKKIEPK